MATHGVSFPVVPADGSLAPPAGFNAAAEPFHVGHAGITVLQRASLASQAAFIALAEKRKRVREACQRWMKNRKGSTAQLYLERRCRSMGVPLPSGCNPPRATVQHRPVHGRSTPLNGTPACACAEGAVARWHARRAGWD